MPRGTSRYDEARLQGRLWTPAVWAGNGLGRWFDAMDYSTITCDGSGNVSAVADKSGLSSGISQPTSGSRPAFDQSFLGLPSFRASAGGKALPYDGTVLVGSNYTIWSLTYSETSICQLYGGTASVANGNLHCIFGTGSVQVNQYSNDLSCNTPSSTIGKTGLLLATTMNPAPNGLTGRLIEANFLSNVPQTVEASTNGATATPLLSYAGAALMSNTFGTLTGGFCEFVVLTRAASDLERQRVQGYMAWKWGITDRLQAAHPYKNRPPTIGG